MPFFHLNFALNLLDFALLWGGIALVTTGSILLGSSLILASCALSYARLKYKAHKSRQRARAIWTAHRS